MSFSAGAGGAVLLNMPNDQPANLDYSGCAQFSDNVPFRRWFTNATVLALRCLFSNNRATCPTCSGGAIAMTNGLLVVDNCSIVNNSAGLYGGGVFLDSGSGSITFQGSSSVSTNAAANGAQVFRSASLIDEKHRQGKTGKYGVKQRNDIETRGKKERERLGERKKAR